MPSAPLRAGRHRPASCGGFFQVGRGQRHRPGPATSARPATSAGASDPASFAGNPLGGRCSRGVGADGPVGVVSRGRPSRRCQPRAAPVALSAAGGADEPGGGGQVRDPGVGDARGRVWARGGVWAAVAEEDRCRAGRSARCHVVIGVADDDGACQVEPVFGGRAAQHAAAGLAAVTAARRVRAVEAGVEPGAAGRQEFIQAGLDGGILARVGAGIREPALVGHQDGAQAGRIELGHRMRRAGQQHQVSG